MKISKAALKQIILEELQKEESEGSQKIALDKETTKIISDKVNLIENTILSLNNDIDQYIQNISVKTDLHLTANEILKLISEYDKYFDLPRGESDQGDPDDYDSDQGDPDDPDNDNSDGPDPAEYDEY